MKQICLASLGAAMAWGQQPELASVNAAGTNASNNISEMGAWRLYGCPAPLMKIASRESDGGHCR